MNEGKKEGRKEGRKKEGRRGMLQMFSVDLKLLIEIKQDWWI